MPPFNYWVDHSAQEGASRSVVHCKSSQNQNYNNCYTDRGELVPDNPFLYLIHLLDLSVVKDFYLEFQEA